MGAEGVVGLLLAAGAGRRAGGPKALRRDPDGTSWLVRSTEVLVAGGCSSVVVVLGAAVDQARRLLGQEASAGLSERLQVVEAADWSRGMGASLRVGLAAAADLTGVAVLVHLVDLPDVGAAVVRRVAAGAGPASLVRAAYDGRPGHPVLIGRDHLRPVVDEVTGDRGAQDYLDRHGVRLLDCGDLATGVDQDDDPDRRLRS